MVATTVPHVYLGMAKILEAMSVAKDGMLPGNMGGKAYITAVAASAETKRQFVANDLVIFSNEHLENIEYIVDAATRSVKIGVTTTGTYKIVSTVDGSTETISGIGDGLANGTAVASNIASTNALKNALLRTFLITEQSVEDEAKNGSDTPLPQALAAAAKAAPKRPASPAKAPTDAMPSKAKLVELMESGVVDSETIRDEVAAEAQKAVRTTYIEADYAAVLAARGMKA